MLVVWAFTITGFIALFAHIIYLRRVVLNRKAQRTAKINGDRMRISNAFVNMEWTRSVINLCFVASGVSILMGFRLGGYLLALPPLLSILASSFAIRGIK